MTGPHGSYCAQATQLPGSMNAPGAVPPYGGIEVTEPHRSIRVPGPEHKWFASKEVVSSAVVEVQVCVDRYVDAAGAVGRKRTGQFFLGLPSTPIVSVLSIELQSVSLLRTDRQENCPGQTAVRRPWAYQPPLEAIHRQEPAFPHFLADLAPFIRVTAAPSLWSGLSAILRLPPPEATSTWSNQHGQKKRAEK